MATITTRERSTATIDIPILDAAQANVLQADIAANFSRLVIADKNSTSRQIQKTGNESRFAYADGKITYTPDENDFNAALGPYMIFVWFGDGRYFPTDIDGHTVTILKAYDSQP